ncbi:hypothetical protein BerOc1_01129 [Pseudodesulfovibrio hydrargyri]|uniref:Uncharacterized protein n=1 Tax=Pseudodesulfovibrio hydrargyri TaxID=2125990 RepID=A0A1J5MRG1_9BACT|nr:hypothetical protein BerOc1_01129 [Pseudodesulfovibrio hydrargyri]
MFMNLSARRILAVLLGPPSAWHNYIDSFKSWSEDRVKRQHP